MRNFDDLNNYVDYVISQVGEGCHTKEEMIEDLQERGLDKEEIVYVLDIAWKEGQSIEKGITKYVILYFFISLFIPLLLIIFYICGLIQEIRLSNILLVIGSFIMFIIFILRKRKFK